MSFKPLFRPIAAVCMVAWLGGMPLHGAMRLAPEDAMHALFGGGCDLKKRTLVLSKEEAARVASMAKMGLETRLYTLFTASMGDEIMGYGILVSRKVRSKSAAVLYALTREGEITAIEIVAFNEPPEFIPPEAWLKLFEGAGANQPLQVGKEIPTITGATLSARSLTQSARLALALFAMKVQP